MIAGKQMSDKARAVVTRGVFRPPAQPATQPIAARPATQPAIRPTTRPTTQPATRPIAARPVSMAVLMTAALLWIGLAAPHAEGMDTNDGGVLLLHVVSGEWSLGDREACDSGGLPSWDQATTSVPADGAPRLVILYAAFPPDSTGTVTGTSFGIQYSEGVRLLSLGPCNDGGMELPTDGWPASSSGNAVANNRFKQGPLLPVYWFALASTVEGSVFEVTPNPVTKWGGRFANLAQPPYAAPIAGFGRIGFGTAGILPEPGGIPKEGACCLDVCWPLSEIECEMYEGVFLGEGTDCSQRPCAENAARGACCLPFGCELHSRLECALLGGIFLGERVACGSTPCPDPTTGSGQNESGEGAPERAEPPTSGGHHLEEQP